MKLTRIPLIIRIIAFLIVILIGLSACQVFDLGQNQPYSPTIVKKWLPTSSPTIIPDQSLLPSPTRTELPPSTETPTPTLTPSITPSPTAAQINVSNAVNLKPYLLYPASFIRGKIQSAAWAPGDQLIVLHTSKGIHFLDPGSLEEIAFYPDLAPIKVSTNGVMITASDESLGWIDLKTSEYQEINIPALETDWKTHPVTINLQGDILVTSDPEREDTLLFYSFPEINLQQEMIITHEKGIRYVDQILFSANGESLFLVVQRNDSRRSLMRLDLYHPGVFVDLGIESDFRELTFNARGDYLAYQSGKPTVRNTSSGMVRKTLSSSFNTTLNNQQVELISTGISFQDDTSLGVAYKSLSSKPESIVIVWNVETGQTRNTFIKIPGRVGSLDFSQDGSLFLVTTEEGLVRIYNNQGEEVGISNPYDINRNFDISPDGRLLAVPSEQGIHLYDPDQDVIIKTFGEFPASDLIEARFINQDSMAVSVYPYAGNPYTELWDTNTETLIQKYNFGNCIFSANGTILACTAKNVHVLTAQRGEIVGSYGLIDKLANYQLSPYGKYFTICSYESNPENQQILYSDSIWLLDIYSSARIRNLVKEGAACGKMAFANSGNYLVSASGGIWSIPEGILVASFNGWPDEDLYISPSDKFFLIRNLLVTLPSGIELGQIDFNDQALAIRFTKDGSRLVILTEHELTYWRVNP